MKNLVIKNRRGDVPFYLIAILIAVAILGITFVTIFVLRGKGVSLIDQIKNLFQGG